jgi:hypothetical protein
MLSKKHIFKWAPPIRRRRLSCGIAVKVLAGMARASGET